MPDLQQLIQKYNPVIETIKSFAPYGAQLQSVDLSGEKLHMKGTVPSQVIANRVWDVIKECDPTFSDLQHEITTTGGPDQSYTIQSGDNLSKVSELFYGTPNKYTKIAEANGLENPDRIRAGEQITIPVLT